MTKRDWRKAVVGLQSSIRDTIGVIDQAGLKIALVTDDAGKLFGVVTDGDVRRGLLRALTLDDSVTEVMNKHPHVATEGDDREGILAHMRASGLDQMPIVDSHGRVTGLETLHGIIEKPALDNWVVLMAGGLGRRLQPLTRQTPKPLLNVGDKPILERIVERLASAGFRRLFVSVHYKAEMIMSHFGDGAQWDVQIEYLREPAPLGTAGCLGLLPEAPYSPLLLMNGDILTALSFTDLLQFHEDQAADVTICLREYDFLIPYGTVEMDNQLVQKIVEKPAHKVFVNAGVYVLSPEAAASVARGTRVEMPDLINEVAGRSGRVAAFPLHEYWLDIGRMDDFARAQQEFGDDSSEC